MTNTSAPTPYHTHPPGIVRRFGRACGRAFGFMGRGAVHNWGRILTIALIAFELSLLGLRRFVGDDIMVLVRNNLWIALWVYFNFQLLETCRRDPTNLLGFFLDSALAVVGVLIGLGFFLLVYVDKLTGYRVEEYDSMWQCTAWGAADLLWGVLISLRIAFAGKERGEFERRATSG